jgi:hypothetical protein
LLAAILLLIYILNPGISYSHKTAQNNSIIFYNTSLAPELNSELDQATILLKTSELYDPELHFQICLNDGNKYPALMRMIRGEAFAWGFYNKVVLQGNAHYDSNYVELNGYTWNLTQLLAHEMVHCMQFNKYGFWKSNPIADIPEWKWEGYPEYIARQNQGPKNLVTNIDRLAETKKIKNKDWIVFDDHTGTIIPYYEHWLLVKYCIDIKAMSYQEVLADTIRENEIQQQMMDWYQKQKNNLLSINRN